MMYPFPKGRISLISEFNHKFNGLFVSADTFLWENSDTFALHLCVSLIKLLGCLSQLSFPFKKGKKSQGCRAFNIICSDVTLV